VVKVASARRTFQDDEWKPSMFNFLRKHVTKMTANWSRFWFTPAEPTVLGAIRVVVGSVACYTLLASSLDLQDMLGPEAWLNLDMAQMLYREFPQDYGSLGWGPQPYPYREPRTATEREYADAYFKRWSVQPPLPYPATPREAQAYEDYHLRWGVDPRLVTFQGRPAWSVWFHVTDPTVMMVVQSLFVAASFLFMLGLWTRVTSALTWFAVLSFIHRAPAAVFGADTMINVLMMYLTIGPSGEAYSLDRVLETRRARKLGLPAPEIKPRVSANVALRLVQVHICIIYLSAGLSKLLGQMWWTGLAPWGTMANFEYSPMQSALYLGALRAVAKYKLLFEAAMTSVAFCTIAFEVSYPFLIWRPSLRAILIWIAVILHAGIGVCMGLKSFAVLMFAFNIAFLSPDTIRWAVSRLLPNSARAQGKAMASAAAAAPPTGGKLAPATGSS
jgi:hypothetical protein